MKTRSKALLLSLCAVLLVAASVLGTMAYLTDQASVTNTFTVGKVAITLDEAEVNADGTYKTNKDDRTDKNEYHLIPGHEYIKDPTVHVDEKSEDCWLFVKVENGISAIEDTTSTIADQMKAQGWTLVDGTSNVYGREAANKAGDNVVVFENFKVSGTADLSKAGSANIIVTAYAIQADGFDTAEAAWGAAGLK